MSLKRFFAPQGALSDNIIKIEGDEFYHLFKVLRSKIGYKIVVSLEDGKDYYCTITNIEKNHCLAKVDAVKDNPQYNDNNLTLFQALPKGNKMDLIIQKCTEIGIDNIFPFHSQYVNEKKFNLERSRRIALEASKQSQRSAVCQIHDLISFEEALSYLATFDVIVFAYEHAKGGRIGEVKRLKSAKNIAYIIGSEGGFTAEEADKFTELGANVVSLGASILRTETAAIVTGAIIKYETRKFNH